MQDKQKQKRKLKRMKYNVATQKVPISKYA